MDARDNKREGGEFSVSVGFSKCFDMVLEPVFGTF